MTRFSLRVVDRTSGDHFIFMGARQVLAGVVRRRNYTFRKNCSVAKKISFQKSTCCTPFPLVTFSPSHGSRSGGSFGTALAAASFSTAFFTVLFSGGRRINVALRTTDEGGGFFHLAGGGRMLCCLEGSRRPY
jgi:hypothetical protein